MNDNKEKYINCDFDFDLPELAPGEFLLPSSLPDFHTRLRICREYSMLKPTEHSRMEEDPEPFVM